jgi:RNA polymerase sigma factor (sigma-70 family)
MKSADLELSLNIQVHQWVTRCVEGDADSYRLLYDHYAKAMYNTALRIVNHTADAEDILQESFIDAFRSLETFRHESTFGAWLKRIVVNKSINKVKRDRQQWVEVDMETMGEYTWQQEPPVDEADFVYKVAAVKKAISFLPDGYRTVLTLHLMENYRYEEIATLLGITAATVRTQYFRAKQKLIEIIRQQEKI